MKPKVDRDRCIGAGQCEAVAPDAFEVNDDGFVEVIGDLEGGQVSDAVESCPSGALSWDDG
ncbi:ferredoxin [Nitriliruptor alkaliphilus]|uniref:ferredoxin n=1 Tax=Nitriliruptor alkaliphilus TaxID=427918 RepID=UPI000698D2E0|nr:ferredoxin [Nitriliruptor alkaliphilus]